MAVTYHQSLHAPHYEFLVGERVSSSILFESWVLTKFQLICCLSHGHLYGMHDVCQMPRPDALPVVEHQIGLLTSYEQGVAFLVAVVIPISTGCLHLRMILSLSRTQRYMRLEARCVRSRHTYFPSVARRTITESTTPTPTKNSPLHPHLASAMPSSA